MRIVFELEVGDRLITLEELQRRSEAAYLKYIVAQVRKRYVAAAILGISRKKLWMRLKALGLSELKSTEAQTDAQAKALGVTTTPVSIAA